MFGLNFTDRSWIDRSGFQDGMFDAGRSTKEIALQSIKCQTQGVYPPESHVPVLQWMYLIWSNLCNSKRHSNLLMAVNKQSLAFWNPALLPHKKGVRIHPETWLNTSNSPAMKPGYLCQLKQLACLLWRNTSAWHGGSKGADPALHDAGPTEGLVLVEQLVAMDESKAWNAAVGWWSWCAAFIIFSFGVSCPSFETLSQMISGGMIAILPAFITASSRVQNAGTQDAH